MLLSSYNGKNAAENLKVCIDAGFAALQAEHDNLQKQASNTIVPIQPIDNCDLFAGERAAFYASDYITRVVESELTGRSYYGTPPKPSIERMETEVKSRAEELKKKGEVIHLANAPKLESNKALVEKITFIMRSIGIKDSYSVREHTKSRVTPYKWVTNGAGYLTDLSREIKTNDGYASMQAHYAELLAALTKYATERRDKENQAKREEEAKTKKVEADRALGVYIGKYGLDIKASWSDILDAVLDKNKYLRLAHHLAKNRADWSDGYSWAETGLGGFKVETDQDGEISDEIQDLITNWDGDGRCFRDSAKWSYDAIFALVPPDLMAEYNAIKEKMPSEY